MMSGVIVGKKTRGYLFCAINFVFIFSCFFGLSEAWGRDSLTWMVADAPPMCIDRGAYRGQGYFEIIQEQISRKLSPRVVARIPANISRHYALWQEGADVCSVGYKTANREEIAYYSQPILRVLPAVLVVNREKAALFSGSSVVSLKKLLQEGNIVFGRNLGRSYGEPIDKIFDTYGNKENVFSHEADGVTRNFLEMLALNRIDAIVCLPSEFLFLTRRLGLFDKFMTIGIEENQRTVEANSVYVICSKTDWGKRAISQIDEVVADPLLRVHFRYAYEYWLNSKYLELYDQDEVKK